MAKNLRPGPNWIPAVIEQRLGPLSYLVKTQDDQKWRRHVDRLKVYSEQAPHSPEEGTDANESGRCPVSTHTSDANLESRV